MTVLTMDKNAVALCREFLDKSAKRANFWLGVQFPLKALEICPWSYNKTLQTREKPTLCLTSNCWVHSSLKGTALYTSHKEIKALQHVYSGKCDYTQLLLSLLNFKFSDSGWIQYCKGQTTVNVLIFYWRKKTFTKSNKWINTQHSLRNGVHYSFIHKFNLKSFQKNEK